MEKPIKNRNRATLEITKETRDILATIGRKNETYNDLLVRLAQIAIKREADHNNKKEIVSSY